jgi:hypothetical protein
MSRFNTRRGRREQTPGLAPQPGHAGVIALLMRPGYWLLFGLPWPGGSKPAAAVIALAPPIISRAGLSDDASDILSVADAYASLKGAALVVLGVCLPR